MKRILLVLSLLVAAFAVWYCGSFAWLYFKLFVWNPYDMKQAIRQYNGSAYAFEETDHVLTNTDQATVYYWSADPIETVRANYEKTGLRFVPGTSQHDWWITAYDKNGLSVALPTSTDVVTDHHSLCPDPYYSNWPALYQTNDEAGQARYEAEKAKELGCITITLVNAGHPSLCTLLVVYPGNQGHAWKKEPYENCSRFLKQGTLIIFNYYLEGM